MAQITKARIGRFLEARFEGVERVAELRHRGASIKGAQSVAAAASIPAAVETAVREVAGLNPPDQPGDSRAKGLVGKFFEFWTEATRARISALKCHVPKNAPEPFSPAALEVPRKVRPHGELRRVFLGYPFALTYVRPAVDRAADGQAQIIVASDVLRGQPLLHKIESMMQDADLCLFDLTLHNPNVAAVRQCRGRIRHGDRALLEARLAAREVLVSRPDRRTVGPDRRTRERHARPARQSDRVAVRSAREGVPDPGSTARQRARIGDGQHWFPLATIVSPSVRSCRMTGIRV